MILALVGAASAQTEVCPGELPLGEWREAMDAIDAALVDGDGARADRILDDVIDALRCVSVPVSPDDLGRFARQVALVAYFAQDPDEMRYWALLARETAGDAPWPDALVIPEPFFTEIAAYPEPAAGRAEGGWVVPRGGAVLVDGRLSLAPAATLDVQHLVQVAGKSGDVERTEWVTGVAFPAEVLGAEVALDPPKWWDEPVEPVEPEPAEPEPVEPEPVEPSPVEPEPVEPAPKPRPVRFDGDGRSPTCEWRADPNAVEVTGQRVKINRKTYAIGTDEERAAFKAVLRDCGEFRAARRFTKWQDARGKLFSGASGYKRAMVEALLTAEPARRKRGVD